MFIAKVKGNIVSTVKNKNLKAYKLLLVHEIDFEGNYIGETDYISLDFLDSGIGDTVLVTREGDAVQQILGHKNAPVNTIIVANVDNIDIK
ncbi:MAG: EutN/CcmL family microcompartment protein [Melioribacteraceae bacterium]|nr:EutN/CcmL family microcompartment protein [Melioribacteraceae bacterium]